MKENVDLDIDSWQIVASKWRSIDYTIKKLSIVEEITKSAVQNILSNGDFVPVSRTLDLPPGIDDDDLP